MQNLLTIGISLALAAALPAMADQSSGGAGPSGGMPAGQMQRGTMQQDRLQDQDRLRDRDQIYGSQLMTAAERNQYRRQMRQLKTQQERDALRLQHHEQMQKRAAERGMKLPDTPPQGMGPGQGQRGMGNGAAVQQRTQQQIEQQQKNQGKDQKIQQQQRTEQQEQQSQDDGNGS
jgi:hypothetical protein